MVTIREYQPEDERSWLECRVLSFLDSAYYDDVLQKKPSYSNPVIDLVAVANDKVVGFIEVEYELKDGSICLKDSYPAAMIWNVGVLPDYRRQGLAAKLLDKSKQIAHEIGVRRFEVCTRDDDWVLKWYEDRGFKLVYSYLHVYLNFDELQPFELKDPLKMTPVSMFAHYQGDDKELIKKAFERVYECNIFELNF